MKKTNITEAHKMPSTKKRAIVLIIPFAIIFLLLGIYLGISIYFQSHFFPKTTISGMECGRQDSEYVENYNIRTGEDYLLTLYDRDGNKYSLMGPDFNYSYISSGEEQKLLDSQNPFAWPAEIGKKHDYTLSASYSYDEASLKESIQKLGIFSGGYTAPENAYLNLNSDGDYEIIPEIMGNTPLSDQVISEITGAVDAGITEYTLTDGCYENPSIYSTDSSLTDALSKINSYTAATIHYEIDGVDENLTSQAIAKMVTVSADLKVSLDSSKIESFVQHLASTYNTYADVRSFRTTEGDIIKIGGGDYGWVINKSKEAEQIMEDLEAGQPVSREPIYEQTAIQSGLDDIGGTYVEIDYTNQHIYYYEDGELQLDSDIVSGKISNGNGSPDGVFKIVYKQSPATLVGEDYESDVTYFMPFAYNVGIHDASWRNKFGGEIYKRSGSHGCINVPGDIAKKLYKALDIGTPVVAYYRKKVKLTSNSAQISNAYSYVEEKDKKDKKKGTR